MIFKGLGLKWAWSKMGVVVGGEGGGGLTWTLILRIFGMVSIFFCPPPPLGGYCNKLHQRNVYHEVSFVFVGHRNIVFLCMLFHVWKSGFLKN